MILNRYFNRIFKIIRGAKLLETALVLIMCLPAVAQERKKIDKEKLFERLSKELERFYKNLGDELKVYIKRQIESELTAKSIDASQITDQIIEELSKNLKETDGINRELKKVFTSKEHLNFVRDFIKISVENLGFESKEEYLAKYFRKDSDTKYYVKLEYKQEFEGFIKMYNEKASIKREPYLGLNVDDRFTDQDREKLGLKPGEGVLISFCKENGPASQAGLKPGQILIKINDDIVNEGNLKQIISKYKPDEEVDVLIMDTDRTERRLKVKLGGRP